MKAEREARGALGWPTRFGATAVLSAITNRGATNINLGRCNGSLRRRIEWVPLFEELTRGWDRLVSLVLLFRASFGRFSLLRVTPR